MSSISHNSEIDLDAYSDKEARLKAAAVFLIARRGYHGTSVRDIAKLTGLTNAGVYHFVENKEALLVDIMRNGQNFLFNATKESLEKATTDHEKLAALVFMLAGAHGKNRLTSYVTDGEIKSLTPGSSGQKEILALRDEYEQFWNQVLADGIAAKNFDIKNAHLAKLAIINMCTGVSAWYRPEGRNSLDEIVSDIIDYAFRVVGATHNGKKVSVLDLPELSLDSMPYAPWEPKFKKRNEGERN